MMPYRRRIASIVGAMIVLLAALVLPGKPALAVGSHDVGTRAELSRCFYSAYFQCLYWHGDGSGAYWGHGTYRSLDGVKDHNLGNNTFFAGTGAGAGYTVRNNAAAMDCDYNVIFTCWSFYSPNEQGNYDYASYSHGGTLFLTWNDEASVEYI